MSQAERLAKLSRWLASPQGLHKPAALRELEISPSTFKRELEFLRSRRNMPIRYDAQTQRYHLDAGAQLPGGQYELPGLWLSAEEIHALLTMQHLLGQIDSGGLLGPHIQPLMKHLRATTVLMRVSHDSRFVSHQLWADSVLLLESIGKQGGGWLKSAANRAPAA